jgi:5'-nucleotidase
MRLVAAAFAASLVVAGCGSDGGEDEPIPQSGERETTTTEETTTTSTPPTTEVAEDSEDAAAADALQVVVTNDDGVAATGLDALVTALAEVDGIEVTVVAPAAQQSGTGGSVTEGPLAASPGETASGHEAMAVDGFPADTVRVAFEDMGLQPDLVISGINEGQNLGGIVEVSGTVGAARAALRLGVPALAVSQGADAGPEDYEIAAGLVVDWLEENRDAIAAGELPAAAVININVPTCIDGELRGTLEVSTSTSTEGAVGVAADCTATGDGYADDIAAFLNGYAAVAEVAVEPAAAA